MSPEKLASLNREVVAAGIYIQPKLPPLASHPNGRNGIAHVYSVIQMIMGVPMKECRDCRYLDISSIITSLYAVADGHLTLHEVVERLKLEREPHYEPSTLEKFL